MGIVLFTSGHQERFWRKINEPGWSCVLDVDENEIVQDYDYIWSNGGSIGSFCQIPYVKFVEKLINGNYVFEKEVVHSKI